MWGMFGLCLLNDVDPYQGMAYVTTFFVVALFDTNFIRKQNKVMLDKGKPQAIVFNGILALISYGLWSGSAVAEAVTE